MNDRHLKSTAFERTPSGFVYYENAWAKGIEVSAREREIYLSSSYSEWLDVITERDATVPRRQWRQAVKRLFLAIWRGYDADSPD